MSTAQTDPGSPDTVVRPCVHCGRPVPQRGSAGRPFRYCRDNDGACQRQARTSRVRERGAPGLTGQVARTWEVVERLEQLTTTLADSLHTELTPAGVERQISAVRAEASAQLAAAHTERDDARGDAQQARAEAAALADVVRQEQAAAVQAAATASQAEQDAQASRTQAQAAVEANESAQRDAQRSRQEAASAQALQAQALQERDSARAALAQMSAQRDEAQRSVGELGRQCVALATERDQVTVALHTAENESGQLRTRLAELSAAHDRAVTQVAVLGGTVDSLREQVTQVRDAGQQWRDERDTARDDAAAARLAVTEADQSRLTALAQVAELTAELRVVRAERDMSRDHVASLTAAFAQRTSADPAASLD